MKRLALLLLLTGRVIAWGAPDPVSMLFKEAQGDVTARKFDDALNLYEQVITGHPEAVDRWFNAEEAIVTTLAAKGDLADAAKAAHLCMDGAPNWQSYDNAVMLAANILSALDKNVDRANQFLTFQLTGSSAGAANPMDAVGYPSSPGREQAFATLRQQAGDNAEASRLRAYTFLFTGKPRDALAQFADAFRRSSDGPNLEQSGPDLVSVGLRDARGHRVGLEKAMQFLIFGPNGPDGTPNTADDIANPFAGLLPDPPTPGNGGLAGLDAAGLDALRQVRDAARLYGGDSRLRQDMRHAALLALQKANDALDAWGEKGEEQWYLQHALDPDDPAPDGLLFTGAQAAARGGALNLGGIYGMWNQVDAYYAAHNLKSSRGPETARHDFTLLKVILSRIQFKEPSFKLLGTPALFGPR
jgi:tetratricopeptide (TPR) repeat protein